jgi:hypothetical protein
MKEQRNSYMDLHTIVANEPDRSDRGTGSGNEVRQANEQGSVRGTHLWYAKLDRGSRSTLFWVDDPGSIEWVDAPGVWTSGSNEEAVLRRKRPGLERQETKRQC